MVIKFDSLIVLISADCHQPIIKVRLIIRLLKLIVLILVLIDVDFDFVDDWFGPWFHWSFAESNQLLVPPVRDSYPPVNIQKDVENPPIWRTVWTGNHCFSTFFWSVFTAHDCSHDDWGADYIIDVIAKQELTKTHRTTSLLTKGWYQLVSCISSSWGG